MKGNAALVSVVGVVESLQERRTRNGGAFARGVLKRQEGRTSLVNWWDPAAAPEEGVRVLVRGRQVTYHGERQVHADVTEPVFDGPPEDPLVARVGYYRDCLRAESLASVRLRPGDAGHAFVAGGLACPFPGGLSVPKGTAAARWLQARQADEPLTVGWPLIRGVEQPVGSAVEQYSPLLIGSGQFQLDASVRLGSARVEVNPAALGLLGFADAGADALARILDRNRSIDVSESATLRGRIATMFALLARIGIEGLEKCTPEAMTGDEVAPGIWNQASVSVGDAGAGASRAAIRELTQLLLRPSALKSGPIALLLGDAQAPGRSELIEAPTVLASSVRQDEAVSCALQDPVTVVTGPPGTGKSQVLANVAAAAVCRGDTVLFASKNNQAIDVVVDRLRRGTSSVVVRTGNAAMRVAAAARLQDELTAERQPGDVRKAEGAWAEVEAELRRVHAPLRERARLQQECVRLRRQIEQAAGRWSKVDGCVPLEELPVNGRLEAIRSAAGAAVRAVEVFAVRPGWWWRRWRHARRLARAQAALDRLAELAGVPASEARACLEAVAAAAVSSEEPAAALRSLVTILTERVEAAGAARQLSAAEAELRQLAAAEAELRQLAEKFETDDALFRMTERRTEAGKALLEARWAQLWQTDTRSRTAALQWARLLQKQGARGAARQARGMVGAALSAAPLWAVTNLSVGSSLPLANGLFDLVVIDEASQSDVASALPLLARGKRALIVGDPHQLPHVTNLGTVRERRIAERWGVAGRDDVRWDYNTQSVFHVARACVPAPPVMLDLHFRSHPAVSAFVREVVYDGELELCWSGQPIGGVPPIEWIDVQGSTAPGRSGRSTKNQAEAQRVAREVRRSLEANAARHDEIGVVTPYRAQVAAVEQELKKELGADAAKSIRVGTAHRFQGSECDILYFSTVVDASATASALEFAADPNLVNVALTRARRRLVIIGNQQVCLAAPSILRRLAQYVLELQEGGFDSPIELQLSRALRQRGVVAHTDRIVAGYRLDLAVEAGGTRLNVECDGAAFHVDQERDAERDRAVQAAGWEVERFSGRAICRDVSGCADRVLQKLSPAASLTQ